MRSVMTDEKKMCEVESSGALSRGQAGVHMCHDFVRSLNYDMSGRRGLACERRRDLSKGAKTLPAKLGQHLRIPHVTQARFQTSQNLANWSGPVTISRVPSRALVATTRTLCWWLGADPQNFTNPSRRQRR